MPCGRTPCSACSIVAENAARKRAGVRERAQTVDSEVVEAEGFSVQVKQSGHDQLIKGAIKASQQL